MRRHQPERVVFDCMVFAQALINPDGPAGACVELARVRRIQLILSDYILQEVRELPEKLPPQLQVTADHVEWLIQELHECSESWTNVAEVYQHPLDPDDSPYINLALAAGAKLIATRDRHLLDLMDATIPAGHLFRRRFPELVILRPEQLLDLVRAD